MILTFPLKTNGKPGFYMIVKVKMQIKAVAGRYTHSGLEWKILTTTPDGGMQKAFGECTAGRFDLMNPTAYEFSCVSGKKISHFRKERR